MARYQSRRHITRRTVSLSRYPDSHPGHSTIIITVDTDADTIIWRTRRGTRWTCTIEGRGLLEGSFDERRGVRSGGRELSEPNHNVGAHVQHQDATR